MSTTLALGIVVLVVIGGTGHAPSSHAAPPPADKVSHGAAGTARNGVGGSIAPSPTMASWPGTGHGRNGGDFAFIGAQYGSLWSIPATANNSLGVGYCVMEDISGEGVVARQPDPAAWSDGEMARAAALMASFGGDLVVPYGIDSSGRYDTASGEWEQPLLLGGDGEYTRRRHVAVNFGVKMFVEDVSPSGVAAGRKLARDTAVVDGSGANFPALRDGYVVATRLASIAEIQHAVGGVDLAVVWGTDDGLAPTESGEYPLEVRVTDATGKPVGFVPVAQLSDTGIAGHRSIGAHAAVVTAGQSADDAARRAAAVSTRWPTMDMAGQMVGDARFAVSTAPDAAAVTDSSGVARFDVMIDRPDWEIAFHAQAPTADVSLYAGTGIQGQITWTGGPQEATVHELAPPPLTGALAVRKVLDHADLVVGRDMSGFEFTIEPIGADTDDGVADPAPAGATSVTTGVDGVTPAVELPVGRYLISETTSPAWAKVLLDGGPVEADVMAGGPDEIVEVAYVNTEPAASVTTAARDAADGDQHVDLSRGDAVVVDTVTFDGLVPGTEYVVDGELMVLLDPAPSDDGGNGGTVASGVVASTVFVPTAPGGSIDVTFDIPGDSPLLGHAAVVFQRVAVHASGRTVAVHHDPGAVEQRVWFPNVITRLVNDRSATAAGERDDQGRAAAVPGDPLTDLVDVEGLQPGGTYRAELTLHERLADGTCSATDITTAESFEIDADSSRHAAAVDVGGIVAPRVGVFVAFQRITVLTGDGAQVVADHDNCDDAAQTVVVSAPPTPTTTTTAPPPTTTAPPPATTAPAPTTTIAEVTTTVAATPAATATAPTTAVRSSRPAALPRTGTDGSGTLADIALSLVLLGAGGVALSAVGRHQRRTPS